MFNRLNFKQNTTTYSVIASCAAIGALSVGAVVYAQGTTCLSVSSMTTRMLDPKTTDEYDAIVKVRNSCGQCMKGDLRMDWFTPGHSQTQSKTVKINAHSETNVTFRVRGNSKARFINESQCE